MCCGTQQSYMMKWNVEVERREISIFVWKTTFTMFIFDEMKWRALRRRHGGKGGKESSYAHCAVMCAHQRNQHLFPSLESLYEKSKFYDNSNHTWFKKFKILIHWHQQQKQQQQQQTDRKKPFEKNRNAVLRLFVPIIWILLFRFLLSFSLFGFYSNSKIAQCWALWR